MTVTPSAIALELGERLRAVLAETRDTFTSAAEAATLAAAAGSFDLGRRLISDLDAIYDAATAGACEGVGDAVSNLLCFLVPTGELDAVLDALDPERHASEDALAERLRGEGRWSDEDHAEMLARRAEGAARYQAVA